MLVSSAGRVGGTKGNILGLRSKSAVLMYGVTNQVITGAGATVGTVTYIANGLYDPEQALGGTQPRGFDQLMGLFDRYCVTGVKIEAWFMNRSAAAVTGTHQYLCGVLYSEKDDSVDSKYVLENPNCSIAREILGPIQGVDGATEIYAGPSTYASLYVDLVKMKGNGQKRVEYINDDTHQGSASANPDDLGYLKIFGFQPGDQSAGSFTAKACVRITYYATFTEPSMPAAS